MSTAVTLESKKILVLSRSWTPMRTISLQEAITKLVSVYRKTGVPKARVVVMEGENKFQMLDWEDWARLEPDGKEYIRHAKGVFCVPEVIILNSPYDKLPQPRNAFSRRMLFKRDRNRCQYCGATPGTEMLNIDHVVPRAQGGVTSWENCVLSCIPCNTKKAARTPEQAKMKLLSVPAKPRYATLKQELIRVDSWQAFLGEAYWTVPLVD